MPEAGLLGAILSSAGLVAVAELGDKTQLLVVALAARYRDPWPIVAGIAAGTVANHGLATTLGAWAAARVSPQALGWALALSFFGFAAWTLATKDDEGEERAHAGRNAFLATLGAFFLAEMGDKTQLAAAALGARFQGLPWAAAWVTFGTTLGMLAVNAPAAFLGRGLVARLGARALRWGSAAAFAAFGALVLWTRVLGQSGAPAAP